ncbi:MAG: FkbM family methyltransferase [Chromatiaceae bacterium]|nr:FkbM family methyltransferase [Chromatiaceae bacterium]
MTLDSRNWIDWNVLFRGAFEPELDVMIEKALPFGGVGVDVGANIGVHTLTMARVVGSEGRVLAFEPNPLIFSCLEANIKLNGMEQIVSAYSSALGDEFAVMQLRIPTQDSREGNQMGLASLVALNSPHHLVSVEVQTLDDLVAKAGISQVDFVKIDVQGFECQVLRGMRAILQKYHPAIVFEYELWAWTEGKGSLAQAVGTLKDAGYDIWYRNEGGSMRTIDANTGEETLPSHVDCIALHQTDQRIHVLGLNGYVPH